VRISSFARHAIYAPNHQERSRSKLQQGGYFANFPLHEPPPLNFKPMFSRSPYISLVPFADLPERAPPDVPQAPPSSSSFAESQAGTKWVPESLVPYERLRAPRVQEGSHRSPSGPAGVTSRARGKGKEKKREGKGRSSPHVPPPVARPGAMSLISLHPYHATVI